MKRLDLVFAALLVPLDYLALVVAGWTAYALRFHQIAGLFPVIYTIPFASYIRIVLVVAAGWIGVLALSGVYALRQRRLSSELGKIFLGASTGVLLVILLIFFQREFFSSRFIILASWIMAVVFLWVIHSIVRGVQRLLLSRGVGQRQTVVIGRDTTTAELLNAFRTHPSIGVMVTKQWPDVNPDMLNELSALMVQGQVDEVLVADPNIAKAQTLQLLDRCTEHNIIFKYAADVFETQAGRIDIQDIAGVPLVEIKRTPLDGWGRIFKRTADLAGSAVGLVLFFIPGVIVAILIKLDSAGPVFIRLDRVGQSQRRFKLWKFRSMIRDAHAMKPLLMAQNERGDGPLFKIHHDPRITRMGRFIRKTSIDELPQLINVLVGEMSLVGPRPHEPEEVARYDRHHKKLLAIKPGMTGMAQVSGRSNLTWEDEVRLDTYYIEHWSMSLDLQILLRTPLAVLNTKTAA